MTRASSESRPTVTVVVPTIGRGTLRRAVTSALSQDLPPTEVLVVLDGPEGSTSLELPRDSRITVLSTGGGAGASAARLMGVDAAQGDYLAFLDDDDEWRPEKLQLQLVEHRRVADGDGHAIVSCRAATRRADGSGLVLEPADLYSTGTSITDYLFVRRKVREGGFGMASSTLFCDRALLADVGWDPALRLHEDWDWVIRAAGHGVPVSLLPDPLLLYTIQPAASATSRPPGGWQQSLAWAENVSMSARARGDFILCVAAVNAITHDGRRRALMVASTAARTGRPSSKAWLAFLAQWLLPGRLLRLSVRLTRPTSGVLTST